MKKKNLSKIVALAVLLGGVSCMHSAWAQNYTITIGTDGAATSNPTGITGVTLGASGSYKGITGGSTASGDAISSVTTADIITSPVYGIHIIEGTNNINFSGTGSSITAKTGAAAASGIFADLANATGTTTVTNLGSITVESAVETNTYGISSYVNNEEFVNNISFVEAGGIINAKNTVGYAYGINVGNKCTTTVENLGSITAEGAKLSVGIYSSGSTNNVTFVTSGGTINVTSSNGMSYGIRVEGTGTTTISGLGSITVERTGDTGVSKNAYGIFAKNQNAAAEAATYSVSFVDVGGSISAYSASGENYGIRFDNADKSATQEVEPTGTSEVLNVKTITAGVKSGSNPEEISFGAAYGIQARAGVNTVTFTGADSSITAKSGGNDAYGVAFGNASTAATGTNTISGLGNITAETTAEPTGSGEETTYYNAYGVYSKNTGSNTFSVSFDTANNTNGSISAYSASGKNYGIYFVEGSTGTSEVKNVKTITAGVKSGSADSSEGSLGIYTRNDDGVNTITFTGAGSSITAKSSVTYAYAIEFYSKGKTTISGLSSITAEGGSGQAAGIFSHGDGSFENNVSFVTSGGSINVKNTSTTNNEANGIKTSINNNGTTTVSNLGSITVEGNKGARGIHLQGNNANSATTNVSFVTSGGTINATSTGGRAYGIVVFYTGTNTISGLGSITATTSATGQNAYGIYTNNTNTPWAKVGDPKSSVTMVNGSISAYSASGDNYGIRFNEHSSTGTSEVTNVKTITAGIKSDDTITSGKAYGIIAAGGTNTVAFTGVGSSITAKSSGDNAYGVIFYDSHNKVGATGTTTVENLGSITAETTSTTADKQSAYGIYSNGSADTLANDISFKGNGGQAITATAADAANAYSIYAEGKGATTVNFESSILSGKVYQNGSAPLTFNFEQGGVWTPKTGDVTGNVTVNANNGGTIKFAEAYSGGNVSVNVNAGGTIDTRTYDAQGKVTTAAIKTINLGTGTFAALPKDEGGTTIYPLISFDAWAKSDNTIVTDQLVTTAGTSGTIKLGSINVKDEATSEWTTAKTANVFVNGSGNAQTGITITGTAETATENYIYTFTGGTAGGVSATSVVNVKFTLPELVQGTKVDKGKKAGEIETFSITDEAGYELDADMGTLGNTLRDDFTINGNAHELKANGKAGVTIGNGTKDILNVTDVTISGFSKFATNAGTLNFDGVTFSGTTGNEDVENNGTLNLNTTATTFDKGISGTGTTYVNVDTDMGTATLKQGTTEVDDSVTLTVVADKLQSDVTNSGTVALGGGTLGSGYTITGGDITINGNVEAGAADLAGTTTISNGKTLTLNGGTIQSDVQLETGTGKTGTLAIAGTVVNNKDNAGKQLSVSSLTINSGSLTTDASKLELNGGSISNSVANGFVLTGGTLKSNISGSGSTKISGNTTLNAVISQNVAIDKTATLTIIDNASFGSGKVISGEGKLALDKDISFAVTQLILTGGITNASKNLTLTGTGSVCSDITGAGTTIIDGTINNEKKIANAVVINANKAFTTTAGKVTGAITNNGSLTIVGDGTDTVTNNGTLTYKDANVNTARISAVGGSLAFDNVNLDIKNGEVKNMTVANLSGTNTLKIDVDMSNFTADKLTLTAASAGTQLNLTDINIVSDITTGAVIELPNTENNKIVYVDGAGKDSVTYGITQTPSVVANAIVLTNNYKYTFTAGSTKGTLNYTVEASDKTLKNMVESTSDITLSLTDDFNNSAAQATLNLGNNMTVNLNAHALKSDKATTINVVSGKTLTLNGGTAAGTTDANMIFTVGGTLAISGNTTVDGTIANNNSLTTAGTTTLNGAVTGTGTLTNTGTLNIAADNLGNNVTNSSGTVNLGEGTLTKTITGGAVNITGDVSTVTTNFVTPTGNTITVAKGKTLTLTDVESTLGITIGGEGNITVGNGTDAAKIISAPDKLTNTGLLSVSEKGMLELTEGSFDNNITNDGLLKLTDVNLGKDAKITGIGKVEIISTKPEGAIVEDVKTLNEIQGDVEVKENKKITLKSGVLKKKIENSGTVVMKGAVLEGDEEYVKDGTLQFANKDGQTETDYEVKGNAITNAKKVIDEGVTLNVNGGTLTNDISGAGTLVIKEGTVAYEWDKVSKISTDVIIESGAILDPVADVFGGDVTVKGKLIIETMDPAVFEGGTLSANVSVENAGTLEIASPVTMATGGNITFENGSTLNLEAAKYYAATENAATPDKAAIQGIDSASNITVGDNAKLVLTGTVENGGYYVILGGTAVSGLNVWQGRDLKELFPDDDEVTAYDVVKANGALSILSIKTTKAEENINCFAGVQQGMLSVNNQVADAVADHLGLVGKGRAEDGYKKDVWASYIRNKDDVNGMATRSNQGSFGSDYRAQVNGVTVGADLFTTKKAIGGIAINYATGDTNGTGERTGSTLAQVNNKTKYYGVEFYNRITNNHHAVLMDIGYMKGKNEISVAEAKSWTADADVNTITAGVRWERDFNLKGSKLVPFAGVRYIRLQSKDFTNSKGLAYSTNSQNLFQPKVGVAWTGEYKMSKSDWTFKPKAEVGYLWALGNREAETNAVINKYFVTNKFDVTDKSSYYAKLGMEFQKNNFAAGVGYSYMKGDAVRGNRWNVNLSWTF